jgi:hypothetical protein
MLINSLSGFVIYSKNKGSNVNLSFFILTLSISMWCLSMIGYRGFTNQDIVLLMSRLLYFSATTIPVSFIYFVIIFPKQDIRLNPYQKYLILIIPIILGALSLHPHGFIYDVIIYAHRETTIVFNKTVHILFGLYVVTYFGFAYRVMYKKYIKANDSLRKQLAYIFVGTFSSMSITLITNLFLLYFDYFDLNWFGQIGIIFMIALIFYSVCTGPHSLHGKLVMS